MNNIQYILFAVTLAIAPLSAMQEVDVDTITLGDNATPQDLITLLQQNSNDSKSFVDVLIFNEKTITAEILTQGLDGKSLCTLKDCLGWTTLHYAVLWGYTQVAQLLLTV